MPFIQYLRHSIKGLSWSLTEVRPLLPWCHLDMADDSTETVRTPPKRRFIFLHLFRRNCDIPCLNSCSGLRSDLSSVDYYRVKLKVLAWIERVSPWKSTIKNDIPDHGSRITEMDEYLNRCLNFDFRKWRKIPKSHLLTFEWWDFEALKIEYWICHNSNYPALHAYNTCIVSNPSEVAEA